MAFIRRRLSGKQDDSYSYQIIETYREGGKVRQRILYNMGPSPTIESAMEVQHKAMADYQKKLDYYLDQRNKPYSERGAYRSDSDVNDWIEIEQRCLRCCGRCDQINLALIPE
jgi:hypothetical protein